VLTANGSGRAPETSSPKSTVNTRKAKRPAASRKRSEAKGNWRVKVRGRFDLGKTLSPVIIAIRTVITNSTRKLHQLFTHRT
jgi:hypothetical protein